MGKKNKIKYIRLEKDRIKNDINIVTHNIKAFDRIDSFDNLIHRYLP